MINLASKTPTILQFSNTECGVVALAILFAYYQVNISLEKLREECGTSRDGCKAATLIHVANKYEFDSAAYTVDIDVIKNLTQPVIAYWQFSHYIVINGVKNDRVYINDPACGPLCVSLDEFDKAFTGIIITLTPTQKTNPIKKKSISMLFIREAVTRYPFDLILILVCLNVATGCSLLNSTMAALFIDFYIVMHNNYGIAFIALAFFLVLGIYITSSIIQKWNQFKLFAKSSIIKSAEMIDHILRLPALFYSLRQTAEISSIVTQIELLVNFIYKNLTLILIHLFIAVLCFVFMIRINGGLSLILLVCIFLSSVLFQFLFKVNLNYEKSATYAAGKWQSYLTSSTRNLETIKACGLEKDTLKKGTTFLLKKLSAQDRTNTLSIIIDAFNQFYDAVITFIILVFGGTAISKGLMSAGNLITYYVLYLIFYAHLISIFQALKGGQHVYASYLHINDMMTYSKDKRFSNQALCTSPSSSNTILSFQDVDFFYNKTGLPTLKNINFSIKAGQQIAFVGLSGSGKSTLAKLCCGLYHPTSGEIFLFGNNITQYTAEGLALSLSYVSQEVALFSGTLYDNLTLWNDSIPLDEVKRAIQAACLEELISRIGLYENVHGNDGHLSGGEKQRIDIARALIQNTPILVLDETTSSLDSQTEKKILAHLRNTRKTIFYVAHRLSSVQQCDQIIVLDKGRIVEQGTHRQLLDNKTYYYHLTQSELI